MEGDCETNQPDSVIPHANNFSATFCRSQCLLDEKCELFKYDAQTCKLFYNSTRTCRGHLGLSDIGVLNCKLSMRNLTIFYLDQSSNYFKNSIIKRLSINPSKIFSKATYMLHRFAKVDFLRNVYGFDFQ